MKLRNAFSPLEDFIYAVRIAFFPTIREVSRTPSLLFHPLQLSRLFMHHVWAFFGNMINENIRETKNTLITPHARGVVLDIGAGYGHTVHYLDKTKVTKYVALEPNTRMHEKIRKAANAEGFSEEAGTLLLLPYGAEETGLIVSALGGPHTIDTLIFILTICSIPSYETAVPALIEQVLKPGGNMLYFEHVRNTREDVAWWQRVWTPIWKVVFDGCCLDRPTDTVVEGLGVWEQKEITGLEGEDPENLFIHSVGRLRKALA